MKIVLDTNVLVSGLLTPYGPSGEVMRFISAGDLIVQYDSRIMPEYQDVLYRPKFQFDIQQVDIVLKHIEQSGQLVSATPLRHRLPVL